MMLQAASCLSHIVTRLTQRNCCVLSNPQVMHALMPTARTSTSVTLVLLVRSSIGPELHPSCPSLPLYAD